MRARIRGAFVMLIIVTALIRALVNWMIPTTTVADAPPNYPMPVAPGDILGSLGAGSDLPSAAPSTATRPRKGSFGAKVPITNAGSTLATIIVTGPRYAASTLNGTVTPSNGAFVSFSVTVTAAATRNGSTPFYANPFDFSIRTPDGKRLTNTVVTEHRWLPPGDLAPNQTATGWVDFDAPPHGTLVYNPTIGPGSGAEWKC